LLFSISIYYYQCKKGIFREREIFKRKTNGGLELQKAIIALMYDFDKTLSPKEMQEYTFIPELGINPEEFWSASNGLAKEYKMDRILAYMYLMISKSNSANKSIRRNDFVNMGKGIEFFPGVEEWFSRINDYGREQGVSIEHYIISSGLKEIIEGSSIKKHFKEIYACEFHYNGSGVADWPLLAVNYTGKTQFLYRINKGVLDVSDDDSINKFIPEDKRRIPFRNMIYIGDGLTDVPCMKLVRSNGGQSIAVYKKKAGVEELLKDNRVNYIVRADYSQGSHLDSLVKTIIAEMALKDKLVKVNQRQLSKIK
jgi:2-hydroxy-3-keto-5-methylthiopentenyl-1-phosphate phosphatase